MYFSKFELLTEYPPGSKSLVKPFKSWIQPFPISAILTEVAGFCCYLPWQGRKSRFSAGLQTLSGALVSITFRTLAIEYRSNIVISEGWLKDRLKETGNSCIQLRRLDGNSTTEQKKKVMADFRTGLGLNMNILKKVNLLQLPDMCRCSFAIWRRIEQQQKKKYISISHPYFH